MLARELSLVPPYLLKLDVQGAEEVVLRGAREVLQNCEAVISEADIEDFQKLNRMLADAGFFLYDITQLQRVGDGTLGWFYPIYLNNRLAQLQPNSFWDPRHNDHVIRKQVERRERFLSRTPKRWSGCVAQVGQSRRWERRPLSDCGFVTDWRLQCRRRCPP